ncbi:MAG: thioredoxin domain-containing protein [Desulfobacterales bacterium]|nr:thioredoxin domain-containing protein [Desulfobacterales bacterium]
MNPNDLIHEKSPYLLQHAYNPVYWYPWGSKAFDIAKAQNKPIFLSIGYATCHWCHVMEKESFEDHEASAYLNDTFICIKVDREERPDIDAVYMAVCHMFMGSGGWPLTIFMTPDKQPFFAGIYIPKRTYSNRIGIIDLCIRVKELWLNQRQSILESASGISDELKKAFAFSSQSQTLDSLVLERAYSQIQDQFDEQFGGFGSSPKFPTPHRLVFLLRYYQRTGKNMALHMVKKTLTAMRLGGIWDHVGFGFHRYTTNRQWLLPHFEKMLYDQALIAIACIEAYCITQDRFFETTVTEIFEYILRDMTSPEGAFFSAEDADSEGEEGKYYVWTLDEFRQLINVTDSQSCLWESLFNLKAEGNFQDEATQHMTGANILHLSTDLDEWAKQTGINPAELYQQWDTIRNILFEYQQKRVHPIKDDKILTDWNGIMIAAFAYAARIFNKPEWLTIAKRAAHFILTNLYDDQKKIMFHRFRQGEPAISGNANDYAFLTWGLLELYRSCFDITYLKLAMQFQQTLLNRFWDQTHGGFFLTEASTELPVRPKEIYDGAIPSANSVAFTNFFFLARLTGNAEFEIKLNELANAFSGTIQPNPEYYTHFLLGIDALLSDTQEIVVVGNPDSIDTKTKIASIYETYAPYQSVLLKTPQNTALLSEIAPFTTSMDSIEGKCTVYTCSKGACQRS